MTFDQFLDSIREPGLKPYMKPYISPALLAKALGVTRGRLCMVLGVHRNSLKGWSPKTQAEIRSLLEILSLAFEVNPDEALFWLKCHPIADLGHKTAIDLLIERKHEAVKLYLISLKATPLARLPIEQGAT